MVNNSTNINKPNNHLSTQIIKESLNGDGQQFHQYHQTNNHLSTQIIKESLNGDGQQFHQYQQTEQSPFNSNYKRKFKRWWSTIPLISTIISHWTQKMTTTYDVWNPDLWHGCFYCKTWRYFNERYLILFHALYKCYGHVYIF